jgi:hypothetical protein
MRYYADPRRQAVAALMQAEVLAAAEAEKLGGWITYLIRDPREPDHRGNLAGTPIYIGQTKQFAKRVLNRFMTSEKQAKAQDSIERRVADLLHQDVVVRYEVLERVATRLTSLVSETNWIKRCRNAAYDLCNNLQEQRFGGALVGRYDIPLERLTTFTVEEALEDKIDVMISCSGCDLEMAVDLGRAQAWPKIPSSIGELKKQLTGQQCSVCGRGSWRSRLKVR